MQRLPREDLPPALLTGQSEPTRSHLLTVARTGTRTPVPGLGGHLPAGGVASIAPSEMETHFPRFKSQNNRGSSEGKGGSGTCGPSTWWALQLSRLQSVPSE